MPTVDQGDEEEWQEETLLQEVEAVSFNMYIIIYVPRVGVFDDFCLQLHRLKMF